MSTLRLPILPVFLLSLLTGGCEPHLVEGQASPQASSPRPMYYPERVVIPKEVPSVKRFDLREKDGANSGKLVILPTVSYLRGHHDGWTQVLRLGRSGGIGKCTEQYLRVPQTFDSYKIKGILQGFKDCCTHVKELTKKGLSDEELKAYCREALDEICVIRSSISPSPASQNGREEKKSPNDFDDLFGPAPDPNSESDPFDDLFGSAPVSPRSQGRSHQLSVIDTAHVTGIPALCLTAAAAFVSASICLKAERTGESCD